MAFGACAVATDVSTLRRLGDLARTQAPGADTHALGGAFDDGSDRLQIRFKPARTDVVRVGNRAADDRPLTANFTSLGHDASPTP